MSAKLGRKPSGVYYADYVDALGKRHRHSLRTRAPEVARQRLAQWNAIQAGRQGTGMDLDGLITWYTDACLAQAAPNTVSAIGWRLGLFSTWARGRGYSVEQALSSAAVLEWSSAVVRSGRTATAKWAVAAIHTMVNKAVEHNLLPSDPVRNWPRIRLRRKPIEVYTPEQVRAIIQYAYTHVPRMGPVVQFEAATGIRRSDMVALRWEWIDLPGRRMAFAQAKTNRALDTGLNEMAIAALGDVEQCTTGRVWPWLTLARLDWFFRVANTKLPFHCSSHKFRHTVGAMLADAGAALPIIAAVLGHASIQTTLIYQHYRSGSEMLPLAQMSDRIGCAQNRADTAPKKPVSS